MSRFASANISIVPAGRTRHAGPTPVARLLMLCATLSAITVAGCARHSDQQAAAGTGAETEAQVCLSERALLAPQSAPDCEFRGSDLKTVDPVAFAHLKLDYERHCYQRAEKRARDRLRLLQASKLCGTKQALYSPGVTR